MNHTRTNAVVMNPLTSQCHCGHGGVIPGQHLIQPSMPIQHIHQSGRCAHGHGVNVNQQLIQQHNVRHIHQQPTAVIGMPGQLVQQQQLVPMMQNIQYIQQQPAVVVGVHPCQTMVMQAGMVVATPVMTTTTMMVPHYCQGSLAMVQMPMTTMVAAPQVVPSMAVPVPGHVIGEVAVVGI